MFLNNNQQEAMEHSFCHRIYVTHILKDFECDVFMPTIDPAKFCLVRLIQFRFFKLPDGKLNALIFCRDSKVPEGAEEENGISFKVKVYEKIAV